MTGRVHDCRILLASLVLLLVLFPAMEVIARPILLTAVVGAVFLVGVVVVDAGNKRIRIAAVLVAIQVALTGASVTLNEGSFGDKFIVGAVFAITAVLIVYCISCVLRYVLEARHITRDQIYAGISIYLMLGFAFGCMYYVLGTLITGSFAVNSAKLSEAHTPDLMYFSFVTLATLGYGDITPVTKGARTMAVLEALAGSLYIAVFMARLVSMRSDGDGPSGTASQQMRDS